MKKALLAIVLAILSHTATAQTAGPVYKVFPADAKGDVLMFHNTLSKQASFKIGVDHVYLGADGQIVREPATDIVYSPNVPFVTLGAGKKQLIRIQRTQPLTTSEIIYRIRVEQLPDPEDQGFQELYAAKMAWVWRKEGAEPQLKAWWGKDGLYVQNTGTASAMVSNLVAGSTLKNGLLGWVLIGETHKFKVPVSQGSVSANVNGKTLSISVVPKP